VNAMTSSPFAVLMPPRELSAELVATVGPTVAAVRAVTDDQLALPTPCQDYDVRQLLNHMIWGVTAFERAGRHVPPPGDGSEAMELDRLHGHWRSRYADLAGATAEAWGTPAAWEGETTLVSSALPAAAVGTLALVDLVVHGWDVSRATCQDYLPDLDAVRALYDWLVGSAELGRSMAVWGPAVPVAEDAPTLERMLGLSGRDPNWTAPPS
jgi:uncharacterized protein (TIGR03086 family)